MDEFYVIMLSDPRVKDFFKGVNMTVQKEKQRKFIMQVTGGP